MKQKAIVSNPLLVVVIVSILTLLVPLSQAYADQSLPSDEELLELKAYADSRPVYPDKNEDGSVPNAVPASVTGEYPMRQGAVLVTSDKYKGVVPSGHAAIIWRYDTVVESLEQGVTWGPNDWNTSKSTVYGLTVLGTSQADDSQAALWCLNQEGKPYNWDFFNIERRDAFYCSQLVWAAFRDLHGVDISTDFAGAAIYPMELTTSPNVYINYKKL